MYRYIAYSLLIIIGIGLDQWTKYWVVEHIHTIHDFQHILPILSIVRTHNTGISFGMLSALNLGPWFYGAVIASIIIFLIYMLLKNHYILQQTAFALMISGAFGNLIDRFTKGYVVDFISLHWFHKYYFYVFNVADILINCGAVLIILDALMKKRNLK